MNVLQTTTTSLVLPQSLTNKSVGRKLDSYTASKWLRLDLQIYPCFLDERHSILSLIRVILRKCHRKHIFYANRLVTLISHDFEKTRLKSLKTKKSPSSSFVKQQIFSRLTVVKQLLFTKMASVKKDICHLCIEISEYLDYLMKNHACGTVLPLYSKDCDFCDRFCLFRWVLSKNKTLWNLTIHWSLF